MEEDKDKILKEIDDRTCKMETEVHRMYVLSKALGVGFIFSLLTLAIGFSIRQCAWVFVIGSGLMLLGAVFENYNWKK